MRTDVNGFLGSYPYRRVPGTDPGSVLAAMDRTGIDEAWVSHLPGIFWRDPAAGNGWLIETARTNARLRPVPAVHPEMAGWERVVRDVVDAGAPAVRCDPVYYGIAPAGPSMRALVTACGRAGLPLMLAVRLEDGRQRHPHDHAAELPAAAVRALVRADAAARLIVTHADRPFVEEVHFGSTPDEAARIWWDICWIWGPPEDHLETLLRTVGPSRFLFGTGQPLRIPENAVAKLDLLDLTADDRAAIEADNAELIRSGRVGGAARR
jgi:predicted TIM-barrel fold metal-dependent hydrolase